MREPHKAQHRGCHVLNTIIVTILILRLLFKHYFNVCQNLSNIRFSGEYAWKAQNSKSSWESSQGTEVKLMLNNLENGFLYYH